MIPQLQSRVRSGQICHVILAGALFFTIIAIRARADAPPVSTHFSYRAPTATSVGLAGEFNSWQPAPMTKDANGNWNLDVPLAPGVYGYKFMVNGTDWEFDPNNAARKNVGGEDNSAVTVGGTAAGAAPVSAVPPAAAPAGAGTVSTHFSYRAPTATSVGLAGEFNSWQPAPMTKDGNGNWTLDVPLAPGAYGYKFMVNGNDWEFDPVNTARKSVDGVDNSSITVTAAAGNSSAPSAAPAAGATRFSFSAPDAASVGLAGEFNSWQPVLMTKGADGTWTTDVALAPGKYGYRFVVNQNSLMPDPKNPAKITIDGIENSLITVGGASDAATTTGTGGH
jgi:1,4-alpha-glucan branching enzyme